MKKLLALALCALTLVFACAAAMADASITFQMGGEPECMDPTINDYSSGSYALQSLFRGLYKYDADGALVPAMAESYEVSEDGCTYTFKLKEGLKWSDGSPLTAHDFEYSWKRVLNPDVGSETAYTLYSVIKDGYECFVSKTVSADDLPIRALDDTTFQVELKAPASYFITLTASTAFMPVCKANVEKYGEDWSSSPETYVCNGPFMLADMKKDESFTFVKNPNYYNADEVKIDTVKYVFLNAPETVRMAFDNGELDIATSVNSDALKAYTGTDKLMSSDRIGYRYYEFNCSKEPFNDARVRRALTLALNRKIHRAYWRTRDGNFSLHGLMGFDMYGKTAGIVGTGRIARELIRILKGFGMEVVANDLFPDPQYAAEAGIAYVPLDELYARADIVSLHCPLTDRTRYMIGDAAISRMKPGVILINTGRGQLIHTEALIDGLKEKKIGAAGLDVYEEEAGYFYEDTSDRIMDDDVLARLLSFNNVIVTSHQGFFTREALDNIAHTTLQNISDFSERRELVNEVRAEPENAVVK